MGRRLSTRENLQGLLRANGATPALRSLLEPSESGIQSGESAWQLSFHLSRLLDGGLTPTTLRLLLDGGYLEQRIETTSRTDEQRTFLEVSNFSLEDRCCFLLTARGAAFVRSFLEDAPDGELANDTVIAVETVRPRWSARKGVLWLGSLVVRRVRLGAKKVRLVLAALQALKWPPEGIDNPLDATKKMSAVQRLKEAMDELNDLQLDAHIEFSLDKSKAKLLWRIV